MPHRRPASIAIVGLLAPALAHASFLSLFSRLVSRSATLPSGWSYSGCYTDLEPGHILQRASSASAENTIESCIAQCLAQGYSTAGLAHGVDCWCDTELRGTPQMAPADKCGIQCPGDDSEMCGGDYFIEVYQRVAEGMVSIDFRRDRARRAAAPAAKTSSAKTTSTKTTSTKTTSTKTTSTKTTSTKTTSTKTTSTKTTSTKSTSTKTTSTKSTSTKTTSTKSTSTKTTSTKSTSTKPTSSSTTRAPSTIAPSTTSTGGASDTPADVKPIVTSVLTPTIIPITTSSTTTATGSDSTALITTSTTTTTSASATPTIPTGPKLVVAHVIVGNTYPYTQANWAADIQLAAAHGLDGFALNVGGDSWSPARIADAYAAAKAFGPSFKLFLSLDMSSIPCSTVAHAGTVQNYIKTYATHPNQYMMSGRSLVSTFAGENCRFGQSGASTTVAINNAWKFAVKSAGLPAVAFYPSFFVDPATFPSLTVMDGDFNWNGGWPMGNYDINFSSDASYLKYLSGKGYIAPVTPWFFTHYSPQTYNKNWIYRGDDWLLNERWELLVQNRDSIALAEVITWNDYGESHYIGPIEGAQPNSQSWVNGYDHQGWLEMQEYYIRGFRTGTYPTITVDRIFLWARRYPAAANAPDSVGRPNNWQWTQDYLWAVAFLVDDAAITLSCGTQKTTTNIAAGVTKLKLPLTTNCQVVATLVRDGQTVISFTPSGFTFSTSPPNYNFNAFVAASGGIGVDWLA